MRKINTFLSLLAVVCMSAGGQAAENKGKEAEKVETPVTPAALPADAPAATIGDIVITRAEVFQRIQALLSGRGEGEDEEEGANKAGGEKKPKFTDLPKEQQATVFQHVLEAIIKEKLLTMAAKSYIESNKELKTKLEENVKAFTEQQSLQLYMATMVGQSLPSEPNKLKEVLQKEFDQHYKNEEEVTFVLLPCANEKDAKGFIAALKDKGPTADHIKKLAAKSNLPAEARQRDGVFGPVLLKSLPEMLRKVVNDLRPGAYTQTPVKLAGIGEHVVVVLKARGKATLESAARQIQEDLSKKALEDIVTKVAAEHKDKIKRYTIEGKESPQPAATPAA